MPTIHVGPNSDELQDISKIMGRAKKVVVVTGAGISTNCGIPDFRSENGLYSMIQAQYDASLSNPPWAAEEVADIDERPKKRQRVSDRWYYEIVPRASPAKGDSSLQQPSRRSSRISSTPTFETIQSLPLPERESTSATLSCSPSGRHLTRSQSTSVALCTESSLIEDASISTCKSSPASLQSEEQAHFRRSPRGSSSTITTRQESELSNPQLSRESSLSHTSSQNRVQSSTESFSHLSSQTPLQNSSQSSQSSACAPPTLISESTSISQASSAPNSSQSSRPSLPNLKGKDLFDSMIWSDAFTTSIFYMFISSLRHKIQTEVTSTTETHKFIRALRDAGRLVRNYTQNIDCLETREGLCTELSRGPGSRARFSRSMASRDTESLGGAAAASNPGVEVVLLHGSLESLRCGLCAKLSSWDEPGIHAATSSGEAPDCPSCTENNDKRQGRGRRGLAIGRLRPDIVLYGEEHPNAHLVAPLITHDLSLNPDVLLILGTSLRVHGLKVMVKEFAKAVHMRGGKVIFVNQTKPPESIWGDVIDYWVQWDCDAWVLDLKERRPDVWSPPAPAVEQRKWESAGELKKKRESVEGKSKPVILLDGIVNDQPERKNVTMKVEIIVKTSEVVQREKKFPQAWREDKQNGVYHTFKILDALGHMRDSNGSTSSRAIYWQRRARQSMGKSSKAKSTSKDGELISVCKAETETTKEAMTLKEAQLMSALTEIPTAASLAPNPASKKRKASSAGLDEGRSTARFAKKIWNALRQLAPSIGHAPPDHLLQERSRAILQERIPNSSLSTFPQPSAKYSYKNMAPTFLPQLHGLGTWPLNNMNLMTQPPTVISPGFIPPEFKENERIELPPPNYSPLSEGTYKGTHQTDDWMSSDTIVVEEASQDEMETDMEKCIEVEVPNVTAKAITPRKKRIKAMGKISAILSSPSRPAKHLIR